MRILHFSDLHLKEQLGLRDKNLLSRFNNFVQAISNERKVDHIFFSGDLRDVRNGVSIDDTIKIFNNIVDSAGVSNYRNIHIVPGNHDLTRAPDDTDSIGRVRKNYDFENGTFNDLKYSLPMMLKRYDEYFWAFCEKFYKSNNPWQSRTINPHFMRTDKQYAFIYLNSCLTCIDNATDGNLIIGLVHLQDLLDKVDAAEDVFIISHHPVQNLATREETKLQQLIKSYISKRFYWFCGDAHSNRTGSKDYINLYQVGSVMGESSTIPDFAVYDVDEGIFERRVFRFLPHLNSISPDGIPPEQQGGWKRIYIDPKIPSA